MTEGIPQEPTSDSQDLEQATPESVTEKLASGEYTLGETHTLKDPFERINKNPVPEELKSVFEHLLKGNPYKVIGVPRADSVVIETMEAGERVEYDYATAKYDHTKSDLPDTAKFSASIHKTFYDGDMPVGGECVANYRDGHWEFVA